MSTQSEHLQCLIIGSGPAGYTAAIYAARADMKPVLYQGIQPGGQLTTTTEVENFPGYPGGITGPEMMEDLKNQAERFGSDIRWGMITSVDTSQRPFKVQADDGKQMTAETIIIATGATAKYLGLETEEKFKGGGVSACATCDGFFYKGKDVAVVGGGDTAAEEATYLAKLAKKVYLIVRRDELRASKVMQKRIFNSPNIEVLWNHETVELFGEENGFMKTLKGARLINNKTKEEKVINVDGFFLAIGHKPNSELFIDVLDMDEIGYIITKPDSTATNIPGIFACGDVQDKIFRQAVTAAGTGSMAALEAERFLAAQDD
ncbi:MAG: thioredoxin-disulfide reductase [Bacteroidales bacterium]|nr:thioredoxin-disulfide reductase [Bacteroidales bacterium]